MKFKIPQADLELCCIDAVLVVIRETGLSRVIIVNNRALVGPGSGDVSFCVIIVNYESLPHALICLKSSILKLCAGLITSAWLEAMTMCVDVCLGLITLCLCDIILHCIGLRYDVSRNRCASLLIVRKGSIRK